MSKIKTAWDIRNAAMAEANKLAEEAEDITRALDASFRAEFDTEEKRTELYRDFKLGQQIVARVREAERLANPMSARASRMRHEANHAFEKTVREIYGEGAHVQYLPHDTVTAKSCRVLMVVAELEGERK